MSLRARSSARFTTIRPIHGPNGRESSNRSSAANAAMKPSCVASSASVREPVTSSADRHAFVP